MSKFPGSKCMSKSHMPVCSGKMSSAKAVVSNSGKSYGMKNPEGRIGANKRTFGNTQTKVPGKG